jgi:hypothetical protein
MQPQVAGRPERCVIERRVASQRFALLPAWSMLSRDRSDAGPSTVLLVKEGGGPFRLDRLPAFLHACRTPDRNARVRGHRDSERHKGVEYVDAYPSGLQLGRGDAAAGGTPNEGTSTRCF